ncbi:hypothetical protein WJX73_002183 [Symbiochloris irregularis]|uniref:F-box domain-containing protein n=1 Tax=Symbiochloris irregularis TaxID=706552 RepID=A0AAW1PXZ3_9CHLO
MNTSRRLPTLPDAIWCRVFSKLPLRAKICCERTSRHFYQLLNRPPPLRKSYFDQSYLSYWEFFTLTLSQLLWSDSSAQHGTSDTSATRWLFKRMLANTQQGIETELNLSGPASSLFSQVLESFFLKLNESKVDYIIDVELADYPFGGQYNATHSPASKHRDLQAMSNVAAAWSGHVQILDLQMPPARISSADVSTMLRAMPELPSLWLCGAGPGSDRSHGLVDSCVALADLGGLETLNLWHHRGLRDGTIEPLIEDGTKPLQGLKALKTISLRRFAPHSGAWTGGMLCHLGVTSLTALERLDLAHNKIESVPEGLSLLTSLTELDLSFNPIASTSQVNTLPIALRVLKTDRLQNQAP